MLLTLQIYYTSIHTKMPMLRRASQFFFLCCYKQELQQIKSSELKNFVLRFLIQYAPKSNEEIGKINGKVI